MNDDEKPNQRLLTLMNQPERLAVQGSPPKGMLSEPLTERGLERAFDDVIVAETVGEMLAKARHESRLSARQAGQLVGASHPRVLAVERSNSRIEVQTLVRYAEALGYDVQLKFIPKEKKGKNIQAVLTF